MLRILYVIVLFIFSSPVFAQASVDRDLIIQKQLNCIDAHLQQKGGVGWNDVCDMPQDPSQQREQVINQQMNQLEDNLKPQDPVAQDSLSEQVPAEYQQYPQKAVTKQGVLAEKVPQDFQKFTKKSNITLELAPEISHISYHEPNLMKEKGDMYGLNAIVTLRPSVGNYLKTRFIDVYRLDGSYSFGRVNYYGGLQNADGSVSPETFNGIGDYLFEIRGLLGKDFYFNNQSTRLTPYMGGGYRYLFDTMSVNQPGGYNRRIQYLYVPTGFELMTKLGDGWSIGTDLEYDIFLRGFVTSYMQTLGAIDANNTQTRGYGLRASIKLAKSWDRFNLFVEPYIRYWHIRVSQVETAVEFLVNGIPYGLVEPNNTSTEVGGRIGIEF